MTKIIKVAELTGALLDYWVARAEDAELYAFGNVVEIRNHQGRWIAYEPSTNWMQGGPIIERERMGFQRVLGFGEVGYMAHCGQDLAMQCVGEGPTHLVAAMRAYVASKFGDEVDEVPQ